MRRVALAAILLLSVVVVLHAERPPEFQIGRATVPPKIDGVLNDDVWTRSPLSLSEWVSYNPIRGTRAEIRTEVRIAYDDRNIYFAFHCFDSEPAKIRTTISRRDTAFNDDWIAMSLDSTATGQTAYHLFVNPSGIQMDALNTTASGEQFEADLLWDSAGKVTDDGYIVEIRLPLQTIRFSGGDKVRMGIVFFRKVSRTGFSYSWPEMPPGQWVFDNPGHLEFSNLKQPPLLELLPSITYGINQTRATRDLWNPATNKADVGLSAKYGIASNITLDATVNPDFSQVESDAFQVQVNQRFPIFYSEKRPFFMEGMGLFNIAGANGDGNLRTAVHTRHIVNPVWGSKITGTAGRASFGLLNAADETPEDIGNRGDAVAGRHKLFTIGRAMYSLGKSDYVGALFEDTEHAGRHNRVAGGDISLKFSAPQTFSATVLTSQTGYSSGGGSHASAEQVSYNYSTRRFSWNNQIEHYGRDFQMDTAFYNRTGFTAGTSYGELNFYLKEGTNFWIKRVFPFSFVKFGHDQVQDGREHFVINGVRFNFTRQGFLNVATQHGREAWLGQTYKTGGRVNLFGSVQLFRWLNMGGNFNDGPAIFYDQVNPFQGQSRSGGMSFSFQPNPHIQQNVDFTKVRFNRQSDGAPIYSVNIVNTQSTYQFDKHFRVRLLEQFDSSQRRLLTDLLAMYEVVPGTVFHAGYGSLYERTDPQFGYTTTTRGLFFKASYLHRF